MVSRSVAGVPRPAPRSWSEATLSAALVFDSLHAAVMHIIFENLIFIVFFMLPFGPLRPPPPSNHHTVVHVHESFFIFAHSLPALHLVVIPLSINTPEGN